MATMGGVELLLEPVADEVEKSATGDPEVVRTAFGKRNRVMVGTPSVRQFDPKDFGRTAKEMERERGEGFELVTVVTTVSFVPDFGCRFVAADVSFGFSGGPTAPSVRPIVIDLQPRESVRAEDFKSQQKSAAKVSGSVSPGLGKILAELSQSNSFQVGGKTMIRDLYAFGVNGPEAGWRFQGSLGHELAGIYGDLLFAVKRPVKSPLFGELKVGAEIAVEALLDRWATLAFGLSYRRTATETVYDLSV